MSIYFINKNSKQTMGVMALDFGDKTIGVAVSDPRGVVAMGIETIGRRQPFGVNRSISRIRELVRLYNITSIIVGYPKNMNNTEGERCEATLWFKEKLERRLKNLPVSLWDERLSTAAALLTKGKTADPSQIDTMAAAYILQGFLDFLNQDF
ncbi:MAG: Holliday junction resolvase RuvX [Clostridiales bacterium]|jgi:putative Holliday junction resolvase|nr:Holliday junction resolvase RuvX [Clostridiales bacterium]